MIATYEEFVTKDTYLPHESKPLGVPTNYDWQQGPVIQNDRPPSGYTAFNPWFQVTSEEDATSYSYGGQRVEIRELNAKLFLKSAGSWVDAYSGSPTLNAAWYDLANGVGETPIGAPVDRSRPGSLLSYATSTKMLHGYPTVRKVIDPTDVLAVACSVRVRAAYAGTVPPWTFNVGADFWPDEFSGASVRGVGQGRFKRVQSGWRQAGFASCILMPTDRSANPEWD